MSIQQTEKKEIFKNIEVTGEKYIEQFKELAKNAQYAMATQVNTAKLEASYALTVSKEQRTKTMAQVKEVRNELWQNALKEANGDIKIASDVYDRLCVFP